MKLRSFNKCIKPNHYDECNHDTISNTTPLFLEEKENMTDIIESNIIDNDNIDLNCFKILLEFFAKIFGKTNDLIVFSFEDSDEEYYVQEFMEGYFCLVFSVDTFIVTPSRFHQINLSNYDIIQDIPYMFESLVISEKQPENSASVKQKKSKKPKKSKIKKDEVPEKIPIKDQTSSFNSQDLFLKNTLEEYQQDIPRIYSKKTEFINNLNYSKEQEQLLCGIYSSFKEILSKDFLISLQYFRAKLDIYAQKVEQNISRKLGEISNGLMPMNLEFLTIFYNYVIHHDGNPRNDIELNRDGEAYKNYCKVYHEYKIRRKYQIFYIAAPLYTSDKVFIVTPAVNEYFATFWTAQNVERFMYHGISCFENYIYLYAESLQLNAEKTEFYFNKKAFPCLNNKYFNRSCNLSDIKNYSFLFKSDIERFSQLKIKSATIKPLETKDFSIIHNLYDELIRVSQYIKYPNSNTDLGFTAGYKNCLKFINTLSIITLYEDFIFEIKQLKVYIDK